MKPFFIAVGLFALFAFFVVVHKNEQARPGVTRPLENQTGRFKLALQGSVNDPDAYGQKRGVYILTDTATGKEYVGVSGIGISELGSGVKVAVER